MWKEKLGLIALTVTAVPAALGVMAGVVYKLPPDVLQVREMMAETLGTLAWLVAGITLFLGVTMVAAQSSLTRSMISRKAPDGDPKKLRGVRVGSFIVIASIVQVPALLATTLYIVGAPLNPVLASVGIATLAVIGLGARM